MTFRPRLGNMGLEGVFGMAQDDKEERKKKEKRILEALFWEAEGSGRI